MTISRVLLSKAIRLAVAGTLAEVVLSCGQEPAAAPRVISVGAAVAAKPAPTLLTVTSASPAFGDQGTTVNVHVLGSGFTADAKASWLLHGVADSVHVYTNSTRFVSSTELIANITIASDAQLSFWDVQVALAGGKNGVGSEAFEVTSAQILGAGTTGGDAAVRDMNDLGQVVGHSGASTVNAWVYDDASGMVNLGLGAAWGIDPLGAFIVGQDGNAFPTSWVRQPNGSWLAQPFSRPSGSVAGAAVSAKRLADGTLVVAGWDEIPPTKSKSAGNLKRPVTWRRTADGQWTAPQLYSIPAGFTSAAAFDVSSTGQIVGQLDASVGGVVWDSPSTFVTLDALPTRVNHAGTLIVGGRNNGPALYWWRDRGTNAWHTTGVPLPSLAGSSCPGGLARNVNDAGVIVGWSCTASGAKLPTVWLLDLSVSPPVLVGAPALLPGLGAKNTAFPTAAAGVTGTAPYVATGTAVLTASSIVAVRWNLR
jgi:probable HAF family extracellular repeat protein